MKTLAFFALSVIASAAMATGPSSTPEITISGSSLQSAALTSTSINNNSTGSKS